MQERNNLLRFLLFMILLFGAILSILPIIWMFLTSIKPMDEVFTYPPKWLPSRIVLSNYIEAWKEAPWERYFLNSIFYSGSVIIGQVITSLLAGYAFSKLQFRGRDLLFILYIGTMMIPGQVTIVPIFVILSKLKWIDTYQGLIVPGLTTAFGTFLFRQFFVSIPTDLQEAALVDGASHLYILRKIFVPLSRPAIITLVVFTFMGTWNDFFWPLIVTNSTEMRTVQIGLTAFQSQYGGVQWSYMMAAAMFVTLPIIVLYLFAQRYFVEGITLTGLKG